MKKFGLFFSLIFATFVTMVASAATATFGDGKLTLNFIGDFAVVDAGNGNITIVDGEGIQLASVIGQPEYDFTQTNDYQVMVYNVSGRLDAGEYTVKIADGAIIGDKTDPWAFNLTSIGAMELPLTVSDGEGGSSDATSPVLKEPTIELIAGAGTNVKYTYPNSYEPENYNKYGAEGKSATLYEDGVEVATSTFGFQMDPTYFYGVHFDYEVTAGKNYKVTFAEGCWYVEYADEFGNSEVVLQSPEVSYTWVGGEDTGSVVNPDDQPGEGSGDDQPGDQPASDISVDFKVPSSLAAITNDMVVANITVDRAYYAIYWEVRCATDPEFYYAGSISASAGAGTYTIIASTPSAEPVELNSGNVYTFSFSSCEFGWDAPALIASFDVNGAGAAAEQFSDIVITEFDGTMGPLGYNFKKKYNFTFSAPVTDVKAFAPMGLEGTVNFPVTAADSEGLKWTVDVSSMANEEGAFELHIQAKDAATGLRLKGTYNLDNSFIYTISISTSDPEGGDDPELPEEEVEIATITINGTVYKLSEQTAIELASYPEGALFTITLADEAIKKVSYEIIDHTTGEILKSVADLDKGENGEWTAKMPRTYDMVAGHVYYIHVVARDGMSSFSSNVLHEYNFLVNGTNTNVAVYSNVKVASIDPSESTIITEATPVITITFTEAIASLSVTAVLGQMSSAAIPAENIATSDNIAWTVSVPKGMIVEGSLSLNFVAIDNEGNRVTDADNGVGLPENCYLHYGWASTVGLPTPELTENGSTVEALQALHFTYDGIGLNQDNLTATWNQITIAHDGVDLNLAITEAMFSIGGDDSVGGTELVLTLTEALTQAGVYTIHVPAYAFMLGHDNNNYYCGECTFTVNVSGTSALSSIVSNQRDTIYQLNGMQAGHVGNGFYIVNGQKVIVK